ncbi:hypothetical protein OG979_17585 [Actinomadura citrea]|uniref:hypothetical protein n=1 Tax=Actinomadura citrea TaxID=46158 RepID=UPI002E291857|nr:hypothetical protein [Actinomadura citrea]
MRRLLALVTALAVAFSLAAVPADAAATLRVISTRVLSPGATTKIEVAAESGLDITKVRAVTEPYEGGSATPLTADDFELVEGTATNGVWRTKTAVTVDPGRWWVNVELTNAEQTVLARHRATVDNGADTVISDFTVTPDVVDIENPSATFRGRLMSRAANGDLVPVAGETLRLIPDIGQFATAVSGADGRVEGQASFSGYTRMSLVYRGSFLYRPTESGLGTVAMRRLNTRLTVDVPEHLVAGDRVNVTGRLEREDHNGVWAPLAGKQVEIKFAGSAPEPVWTTLGRATTGAGGAFTFLINPSEDGAWSASFATDALGWPADHPGYFRSEGQPRYRSVAYRTSVTGFNATPEPVGRGENVKAYGRVLTRLADGRWTGAPGNASVQLQFSTDRRTWSTKGAVGVFRDGTFSVEGRADRTGYWRALVPKSDSTEQSVSGNDNVEVRYRTKILDFNAAPEPVKKGGTVTVMGTVYRQTSKWYTYGGKTVVFYFLPKGSSKWVYMGKQATDRIGRFRKGFKATKDGTWRAYSGATSTYAKTYREDYVDVR